MADKGMANDLMELYELAKVFEDVAGIYRKSGRLLNPSDANWSSMTTDMEWQPAGSGEKPHPVVPPWYSLRDETSSILAGTATNLEDTAHALIRTADAYAATDQEAAAEFKRQRADHDAMRGR